MKKRLFYILLSSIWWIREDYMSDFLVDGLIKLVGDKMVFSNVLFIIYSLDCIGIIGVNGIGKIILLDVILGELGFDGDCFFFLLVNDYKIVYLK